MRGGVAKTMQFSENKVHKMPLACRPVLSASGHKHKGDTMCSQRNRHSIISYIWIYIYIHTCTWADTNTCTSTVYTWQNKPGQRWCDIVSQRRRTCRRLSTTKASAYIFPFFSPQHQKEANDKAGIPSVKSGLFKDLQQFWGKYWTTGRLWYKWCRSTKCNLLLRQLQ